MAKPIAALAGALLGLGLASCGGQESMAAGNGAAAAEPSGGAAADSPVPEPADGLGNGAAEPVPPPDAVSHPEGYLPPAPGSPDSNSSGAGASPPTTEDQYLRNQSGR